MIKRIHDRLKKCLPSTCQLCGLTIGSSIHTDLWCRYCYQYFQATPRCQRCGVAMVNNVVQCGLCLTNPPRWNRLYCIGDYQPPISHYIHNLKYQRQFWYACNLADLLASRITEPAPLLTSVPLHWTRYLTRGFNQSHLLTKQLLTHWPHSREDHRLFRRVRATRPQQGLNKSQRHTNLKHAFALNKNLNIDHVAIVDDVVTTGATVEHLTDLLIDIGVKKIDIYCLCRTPELSY